MLRIISIINLNRPIPVRIGKQTGHIAEIHNSEMCFPISLSQTGATANDLLELGHRTNHLIQNDQLCHLAVSPG